MDIRTVLRKAAYTLIIPAMFALVTALWGYKQQDGGIAIVVSLFIVVVASSLYVNAINMTRKNTVLRIVGITLTAPYVAFIVVTMLQGNLAGGFEGVSGLFICALQVAMIALGWGKPAGQALPAAAPHSECPQNQDLTQHTQK